MATRSDFLEVRFKTEAEDNLLSVARRLAKDKTVEVATLLAIPCASEFKGVNGTYGRTLCHDH